MSAEDIINKAKQAKLLKENKEVKEVVDLVVSESVTPAIEQLNDKIDSEVEQAMLDVEVLDQELREEIREIELTPGPQGEKGDKGDQGDKPVAGEDYPVPKDGEDYVLTDEDKEEIAGSIEVPVVEKVIERTETIIEKPSVTEKVVQVAKYEEPEVIATKLNTLEEKVDIKVIKGLQNRLSNIDKNTRQISGGGTVEFLDEGVQLTREGKSVNFVGDGVTATKSGSSVTITIPGGAGSGVSESLAIAYAVAL